MIKRIPLDGGLITQADPEEVGSSGCVELVDTEFDKFGMVYSRPPRGDNVTVSDVLINEITRWVDSTGTYYWIVGATDGKVYKSTNLASLTELFDSSTTRTRISNYGTMLRFANGTGYEPKVYQKITRAFFWDALASSTVELTDLAKPRAITSSTTFVGKDELMRTTLSINSGLYNTLNTYDYKLTYVYDGDQESKLPEDIVVTSNSLVGGGESLADNNDSLKFKIEYTEANWNKRITSINVYRSQNDGIYYKVSSISTLGKSIDGNTIYQSSAVRNSATLGYVKVTTTSEVQLTAVINDPAKFFPVMSLASTSYIGEFTATIPTHADGNKYWKKSIFLPQENEDFETSIGTWSNSNYTAYHEGTERFSQTKCVRIERTNTGSTSGLSAKVYSSLDASKSYKVTMMFRESGVGTGMSVRAIKADGTQVSFSGSTTYTGADGSTWTYRYINEFTGSTTLELRFFAGEKIAYIDNFIISKDHSDTENYLCSGDNTAVLPSLNLGSEDSKKGYQLQIGSNTVHQRLVQNNVGRIVKGTDTLSSGTDLFINKDYLWIKNSSNNYQLTFIDSGLTNGIVHPTGETSLDVNFTYSVNLEGRQYVAGVALNPSAENEIHDDWVMFSELSQPDVIPITNYISIPDLQGGAITGLAKLLGDLVVFQNKGVYRISIPSAEPASWSLSESEANIGCIAPDSIVEYEAGVFFAGSDHIYYLDSNFNARPVTISIRDDYQARTNTSTKFKIDVKKNRLICLIGSLNGLAYVLDLNQFSQGKEHWSMMNFTYGGQPADILAIDENLEFYTLDNSSTSNSILSSFYPTTPSESKINFSRETGWIGVGNFDDSKVIRRLNFRYISNVPLTVSIRIDGELTIATKGFTIPANTVGVGTTVEWYRTKPSVRCRYFKVKIFASQDDYEAPTVPEVELKSVEVDFE